MTRNLAILTIISLFASAALAQVLNSDDASKRLHALFAEDWQWFLEQYPEAATLLGDNRYNDRLTDLRPKRSPGAKRTSARCLTACRRSTAPSLPART